MAESVVGRGIIELVADARKLKAGFEEAKKATRTLGEGQKEISRQAQRSIDSYIAKLEQQNKTIGKSTREIELFKLAQRGASNEQLNAANIALLGIEKQKAAIAAASLAAERHQQVISRLRGAFLSLAAASGLAGIASVAGFTRLITGSISAAAELDDLAEKTGASVENLSKLSQQAKISGTDIVTVETALVRLARGLSGTEEESAGARRALAALGLEASKLRGLDTAEALKLIAVRLNEFSDGAGKTAVALALFGRGGAQALPFLKDLATDGALAARVTAAQAAKAEELEKAWRRLGNAFSIASNDLALNLVPGLTKIIERMNEATLSAGSLEKAIARFTRSFFTKGGVGAVLELFPSAEDAEKRVAELTAKIKRLQGAIASPAEGIGRSALPRWRKELEEAKAELDEATKSLDRLKKAQGDVTTELQKRQERLRSPGERALIGQSKPELIFADDLKLIQQVAAERASLAEKTIAAEAAATQARLASTAHLLKSQQELEQAELASIAKRVAAAQALFQAETTFAKSQDSTVQKSYEDQRAAGNKLYDTLIARNNDYLNIFKANQAKIKSLDDELVASRKRTADFIKGIEQEKFTPAQKREAITQDAFAALSKQRDAVLAGDVQKQKQWADEAFRTAEAFKAIGQNADAINIAEESQRLTELGNAAQTQAAKAAAAAARTGAEGVTKQIADIEKELARIQGTSLAGIKVGVDQASLAALVDDMRTKIEAEFRTTPPASSVEITGITPTQESLDAFLDTIQDAVASRQFQVNLTPNIGSGSAPQTFASGGPVRGFSPTPRSDNILARLTAGEYVVPVPAVRHYGADFMDAIRSMAIPKFADGGSVGASPGGSGSTVNLNVNIGRRRVRLAGAADQVREFTEALAELELGIADGN